MQAHLLTRDTLVIWAVVLLLLLGLVARASAYMPTPRWECDIYLCEPSAVAPGLNQDPSAPEPDGAEPSQPTPEPTDND